MSSLIVEVCKIDKIARHTGADKLEIAVIKGWECIVKKGQYKRGDTVIYIPPDSLLPEDLADRLGIRNYLVGKKKNRVKCAKLRGIISSGLIIDNEENWTVGTDVASHYGILKYEPPVRTTTGDTAPEDPHFQKFTEIENIKNYPDIFKEGEMVYVTEKVDGTNSRTQLDCYAYMSYPWWKKLYTKIFKGTKYEWKAGSHNLKRKKPVGHKNGENVYWYPSTIPEVKNLLNYLTKIKGYKSACLYGEIYGRITGGLKSMTYGKEGKLAFVAFAIKLNGYYMNYEDFAEVCKFFKVPTVPVIAKMPFNFKRIKELSGGVSVLASRNGAQHFREGVVVYPVEEREERNCGRVTFKFLSDEYLLKKEKKHGKGEQVDFKDV
jgi:RNA ligase (TIGR02306 family)